MTPTIISARYANPDHSSAIVVTAEVGHVLASEADTPGLWAALESVEVTPYAPPAPGILDYQRAVEAHVEATAQARNYSSAVSCVSYMLADPSDPTLSDEDRAWDAEARVFHRWRNAVWAQVFAALEAWQGGDEAPTIEGLIASLPAIEWPS